MENKPRKTFRDYLLVGGVAKRTFVDRTGAVYTVKGIEQVIDPSHGNEVLGWGIRAHYDTANHEDLPRTLDSSMDDFEANASKMRKIRTFARAINNNTDTGEGCTK